jgi:hypothetical protein
MELLSPSASFANIRRFAKKAHKTAEEFGLALDRFGREPGETWHAAADGFREKLAGLEKELASVKDKTSLPAAARKEFAVRVQALAGDLAELRRALRCLVLDACPQAEIKPPAGGTAETVWKNYDKLTVGIADRVLRLDAVVRLAQRSHGPAAAFALICPLEERLGAADMFNVLPALGVLLQHIPLPRLGGLTLMESIAKDFREQALSGAAADGLFARFLEGMLSGDPDRRKAARKELDCARNASSNERYGRASEDGFSNSREILGVWSGVKAALADPDPVRRRAALCALPALQFSFITRDSRGDCAEFIARGMDDEDGTVRYKTLRFASDLALIGRVEDQGILALLEKTAERLVSETKKKRPQSAACARKLLKRIAGLRKYDRERANFTAPRVAEPEGEGRELSFTVPRRLPFETVFQFKITLLGTQPPIWRRLQVPGSYTFYDLHVAIQNAMGWSDSHLHVYEIGEKRKVCIESPYAVEDLEEKPYGFTPEIMLRQFFKKENDSAIYIYDFGDDWRHEVLLEDIQLKKTGLKYPMCMDGELACPPEDCGGIGGYTGCVEAATSKAVPEEDDEALALLTWLDGWSPEKFNPKDVLFENPAKRFLDSFEED